MAATKTFCSQVATLAQLAVRLGRARGALSSDVASDFVADVRDLPGAVQQVLYQNGRIREFAEECADSDAFFYIGRRLGHPVALEGALRLKEFSYDHVEDFPVGELKQGPFALVTPASPVLAVLTEGSNADETMNNVKEAESCGAPFIGFTDDSERGKFFDTMIKVPEAGLIELLVVKVYTELFSCHVADLKWRPIDNPRNLVKSVTVE